MITTTLQRYFVLTAGRTGSSLLCAILADAGANFGMQAPRDWDPRRGVMENETMRLATHHYRRAYEIDQGRRFKISPGLEAKWRRGLGRNKLRQALGEADYFKIGDLDLAIQPSFKLGYQPKLIISYRQFEPAATSLLVGRTHNGPDELAADYTRLYRQGLMLLHCFGGCVVAYTDLHAGSAVWGSVAEVTGLEGTRLLAAAGERVQEPPADEPSPILYPAAHAVYEQLEALRGQHVAASRPARRANA